MAPVKQYQSLTGSILHPPATPLMHHIHHTHTYLQDQYIINIIDHRIHLSQSLSVCSAPVNNRGKARDGCRNHSEGQSLGIALHGALPDKSTATPLLDPPLRVNFQLTSNQCRL